MVVLAAPVMLGSPEAPWAWAKVAVAAAKATASDAEVEVVLAAVLLDMVSGRLESFCVDPVLGEKVVDVKRGIRGEGVGAGGRYAEVRI